MSNSRLEELTKNKFERQERKKVFLNNISLRIATLQERILQTEKITSNETPINIAGMLFQILENQEHIMASLVNIQQKMLNDNIDKED